jgi:hypothetical protein
VVQEKKNEAVHMEEPRRQETIPNQLHSGQAALQKWYQRCEDTPPNNILRI